MPALPHYTCYHTPHPIRVDGRWEKAAWRDIPPTDAFVNDNGKPASQETVAKLCWDETHLYVAFFCADDDVWGTLFQHDDPIYNEDVVEVFLNPSGDLTHYYEFIVSPHNTIYDGYNTNAGGVHETLQADKSWTCEGLITAVQVQGKLDDLTVRDEWWTVEIAIPWSGIGQSAPHPGDVWRLNLFRIERDRRNERGGDEYLCWSPTLRDRPDNHVTARFGFLQFVGREGTTTP